MEEKLSVSQHWVLPAQEAAMGWAAWKGAKISRHRDVSEAL